MRLAPKIEDGMKKKKKYEEEDDDDSTALLDLACQHSWQQANKKQKKRYLYFNLV